MNTTTQILDDKPGPVWTSWVNPQPQAQTGSTDAAAMRVVKECTPKPALIHDAETGKKLAVLSFRWGDALEVAKPEAVGIPENQTLPILAYGYDEQQELFAITEGDMPKQFRTKATFPDTHEVVFKTLPATIAEWCIVDYKNAFKLRRYEYKPEVNKKTKQISINFNDLAA